MKKRSSMSNALRNLKFDFIGNFKYFIILPIVILVAGLVLMLTIGFNTGLDFSGGTIVDIILGDQLKDSAYYNESVDNVEEVLNSYGLKIGMVQLSETEKGDAISVRYQDKSGLSEEQMNELNDDIKLSLLEKFGLNPNIAEDSEKIQDSQRIGATASSELLTKAFIAILVVIAAVLIYIALRFEFTSGMAAILSLFHDVLIMASLVIFFRIEINSSFIAAIITIIGYSINNTIIIFDRIRENMKNPDYVKYNNNQIANLSIKESLTRSVYTIATTFITISMVALLGSSSIRQFALPIIFGLIAGAYSSIFIAPGLWSLAYVNKRKKSKFNEDTKVSVEG